MKKKIFMLSIGMLIVFSTFSIKSVDASAAKVAKVSKVAASKVSEDAIKIKWSKVKNVKKYQLTYSTNKKFKSAKTKITTKNSLNIKNLNSGTKYYIKVRAVSKTNNKGKWSATKSITTDTAENILARKTGYFYIKVVGNGKTTTRKVTLKADGKNLDKDTTVSVSLSGTNYHNLLVNTADISLDYKTFKVGFDLKMPAHIGATASTSGSCSEEFEVTAPGYFGSTYILGCYHSLTAESYSGSVTLSVDDVGLRNVNGKQKHATITFNYKDYYGGVKVNPNGGNWKYGSTTYTSLTSIWAGKCGSTMNIPNPTRNGYVFVGWTTTENSNNSCSYGTLKGSVYKNMNTNITTSSSTFTFCGEATSLNEAKDTSNKYYTTLTAMWKKQ